MNFENESFTATAANGQDDVRDYILNMIRSLSRLARRSREDQIAILLDAIAAAVHAGERPRRP